MPDDVANAARDLLDFFRKYSVKPDSHIGVCANTLIRAASTPSAEVRALREAIDGMRICHGMTQAPMTDHAYWNDEFERKRVEALASLNAVLEEGGR